MLEKAFQVRPFKREDLDQVMHINWTCLPENYTNYFFLDLYHRFPKTFIVAVANEKIVGYIMCRIELGLSELNKIGIVRKSHVVSIAVLPEYRRKGIGKTLVANAMQAMLDYDAAETYLEVRVTNNPAVNLYKKLGFEVTRRIRGYYQDNEDAFVMARKLPYETF